MLAYLIEQEPSQTTIGDMFHQIEQESGASAFLNACGITSASFFEDALIPWHSCSTLDPNFEIT
jgi:hypothetical protein